MSITRERFLGGGRYLALTSTHKLTYGLARAWNLSAAASGKSVTLSDATRIGLGFGQYLLHNSGANTIAVKDATGAALFDLAAGSVAALGLVRNDTPAGKWIWFLGDAGASRTYSRPTRSAVTNDSPAGTEEPNCSLIVNGGDDDPLDTIVGEPCECGTVATAWNMRGGMPVAIPVADGLADGIPPPWEGSRDCCGCRAEDHSGVCTVSFALTYTETRAGYPGTISHTVTMSGSGGWDEASSQYKIVGTATHDYNVWAPNPSTFVLENSSGSEDLAGAGGVVATAAEGAAGWQVALTSIPSWALSFGPDFYGVQNADGVACNRDESPITCSPSLSFDCDNFSLSWSISATGTYWNGGYFADSSVTASVSCTISFAE